MNRWTLHAMASASLAIAGVACLKEAGKPPWERESTDDTFRARSTGTDAKAVSASLPAPKLPTKSRDQRPDGSFSGKMNSKPIVIVGGQVREPGPVAIGTAPDLWSAIHRAGGATEFGAMNRVRLTRERWVKEYDMNQPEHRGIPLNDRDSIEVPQKMVFGR